MGLPAYLDQKAGSQTILPYVSFGTYQDMSFAAYPTVEWYRVGTAKAD